MNANYVKVLILAFWVTIFVTSCNKEEKMQQPSSEIVNTFLELKTKMNVHTRNSDGISNFMSIIGKNMMMRTMKKGYSLKGDSISGGTDSTGIDSTWYWDYKSCAQITEYVNNEGMNVTVYDYGTGCDEYGVLFSGKITYLWRNNENEYYSSVIYEEYSSYGMTINGTSSYQFEMDGTYFKDSTDVVAGKDSTTMNYGYVYWSGVSSCSDDIEIVYETGEHYIYNSAYKSEWKGNNYTLISGKYIYEDLTTGDKYEYSVKQPLVYNYDCVNVWVAVSGVESIYYKDIDEEYQFTIDYGNGTCDNLAILTENGESYEIDFEELYKIYYNDSDGTVTTNGK